MGFSVSIASAILFSTFLFLSFFLFGSLNNTLNAYQDASEDDYELNMERRNTDLDFLECSYNKISGELKLWIKNDSNDVVLDPWRCEFLVNGTFVTDHIDTLTIGGVNTTVWHPGETLRAVLTNVDLPFDNNMTIRTYQIVTTQITSPTDVCVCDDYIFISDNSDHIDVFDRNGTFKSTISDADLGSPETICASNEYLYIIDTQGDDHIDRYNILDSTYTDQYLDNAQLQTPVDIAVSATALYIADNQIHVDRYTFSTEVYNNNFIAHGSPKAIEVDDYIYIIDDDHIDRFNLDGSAESTPLIANGGQLDTPRDIAIDDDSFSATRIVIADDNGASNDNHLDVYYTNGTYDITIEDSLSDTGASRVDIGSRIFSTDSNNGLVISYRGTEVKVVTSSGFGTTVTL